MDYNVCFDGRFSKGKMKMFLDTLKSEMQIKKEFNRKIRSLFTSKDQTLIAAKFQMVLPFSTKQKMDPKIVRI